MEEATKFRAYRLFSNFIRTGNDDEWQKFNISMTAIINKSEVLKGKALEFFICLPATKDSIWRDRLLSLLFDALNGPDGKFVSDIIIASLSM